MREVWYQGGPDPDHAVDITDQFPASWRRCGRTRRRPRTWIWKACSADRLSAAAAAAGLPEGRLAEAFTVLRTE